MVNLELVNQIYLIFNSLLFSGHFMINSEEQFAAF